MPCRVEKKKVNLSCVRQCHCNVVSKGPCQPPPFSMPSKLFTLLGEAKSYYFSVSCVPEGMFDYL